MDFEQPVLLTSVTFPQNEPEFSGKHVFYSPRPTETVTPDGVDVVIYKDGEISE